MYSNNEFDNNSEHEQNEEVIAPEAANFTYNSGVETNFCCPIDREIHNKDSVILIENAQKTTDNNGSTFITYTIKIEVNWFNSLKCLV